MNSSSINPEQSPLRDDEAEAGGEGAGLVAGLDKFLDDNPDASATEDVETPVVDDSEAPEKSPADEGAVLSGEDEDFGLPTIRKEPEVSNEEPVTETVEFDESEFDEATNQEIKGLDPSQGEAWKKLKEELKSYKKGEVQLPEIQKKLEALEQENRNLRDTADEVEAIKERMKSVTSRNAELLLEESSEYYSSVVQPHKQISGTIEALSEAKGIDKDEIWSVIKQSDPAKRISMLDELERHIGGRNALLVQTMADDMRAVAIKDREMRENAEQIVNQSRTADARIHQEQTESQIADFKASSKQAFVSHASKIPGFVDDTGSLTDEGRRAQAHTSTVDVTALTSGDLAYMAFTTEALPQSLRKIRDLEKENRDLRVAAGDNSSNVLPGASKKKDAEEEYDSGRGGPMGLLDHMEKQTFDSAV